MTTSIAQVDTLLARRESARAALLAEQLVAADAQRAEHWLLLARARQQLTDFEGMLAAARRAADCAPRDVASKFVCIEAQLQCGEVLAARQALRDIEALAGDDAMTWRRLTECHVHCGQHADAARCARTAATLLAEDSDTAYALASALIATGAHEEAEQLLDRIILSSPDDGDAAYNRATLRRQSPARNHVSQLQLALRQARTPSSRVALNFALAKDLEDLEQYPRSFAHLRDGADARRRLMSYRVETDEQAMAQIARCFDRRWCETPRTGCDAEGPIFIVGLPRSGTTLVERMLGRHADVGSVGEVNDLPLAVTRVAGGAGGKSGLIERATRLDCAELGATYWRTLRDYGLPQPRIIDKTPLNFLYVGLIARALPKARIVHLRRHPVASGYAMYKTLFRMGYPFSYDLLDIGRYLLAYQKLMAHWREVLPDTVLDLDYEALVTDPQTEGRRLLEFCGLEWDPRCLSFHEDPRPTATASAAQVRRPFYRDSIDQWRNYESELAPLIAVLRDGGVACA